METRCARPHGVPARACRANSSVPFPVVLGVGQSRPTRTRETSIMDRIKFERLLRAGGWRLAKTRGHRTWQAPDGRLLKVRRGGRWSTVPLSMVVRIRREYG